MTYRNSITEFPIKLGMNLKSNIHLLFVEIISFNSELQTRRLKEAKKFSNLYKNLIEEKQNHLFKTFSKNQRVLSVFSSSSELA